MQAETQVRTLSAVTPPPSPACYSPTASEGQKQQDLPVKQEDLVSSAPLQFLQVSGTFLCHLIHLGCVARPPTLGDPLLLLSPSSHTPQHPLSLQESTTPPSCMRFTPEAKQAKEPDRLTAHPQACLRHARKSIFACLDYESHIQYHRFTACIDWLLILTLKGLLSLFVWNPPTQSHISHIIQLPKKLPCTSVTNHFSKSPNALTITQEGQPTLIYHDHTHITLNNHFTTSTSFPYGWSCVAKDYCINNHYHPNCHNPKGLCLIEADFVEDALQDPGMQQALDEHINIIHNHQSRKQFQWLLSSEAPIPDSCHQCLDLT